MKTSALDLKCIWSSREAKNHYFCQRDGRHPTAEQSQLTNRPRVEMWGGGGIPVTLSLVWLLGISIKV